MTRKSTKREASTISCSGSGSARYVATFFSHYDAVVFAQALADMGIDAKPMPVPRRLSSSCGTGVRFETDRTDLRALAQEGLDKIYRHDGDAYTLVLED